MEFKVRQESHSLLEKMFSKHSRSGAVSANVVPGLLKEFNEDIAVTVDEVESLPEISSEVEGGLGWDSFEKVMLHYLVKQSKKESNEFAHKNIITLSDFDTP